MLNAKMTIDAKEFQRIREIAANIREKAGENSSPRAAIVEMHMKYFPNSTREAAEKIADEIVDGVTMFDEKFEEAKNSDGEWLKEQLGLITRELSLEDRQKFLLGLLVAVRSVEGQAVKEMLAGNKDLQKILDELELEIEGRYSVAGGSATEEGIKQLEDMVIEAASNSSISFIDEPGIKVLLDELKTGPNGVESFVRTSIDDKTAAYYDAYAAYVASQRGELKSIPADTPAAIVAASVAAGRKKAEVLEDLAEGKTTWQKAVELLKCIGKALWVCASVLFGLWAFINLIVAGLTIGAVALAGAPFLVMLCGMLAGGYAGYWLGSHVCGLLLSGSFDWASDVIEYTARTAIPAVKEGFKRLKAFITGKVADGVLAEATEARGISRTAHA